MYDNSTKLISARITFFVKFPLLDLIYNVLYCWCFVDPFTRSYMLALFHEKRQVHDTKHIGCDTKPKMQDTKYIWSDTKPQMQDTTHLFRYDASNAGYHTISVPIRSIKCRIPNTSVLIRCIRCRIPHICSYTKPQVQNTKKHLFQHEASGSGYQTHIY